MNLRPLAALACTALIAVGLAACGDDNTSTSSASDQSGSTAGSTAAASNASVSFTEPADGSTNDGTVTANVKLTDFTIDKAAVGMAAVPGHGHIHFSMDGGKFDHEKYSGANGALAKQLGVDGQYSPAVAPTITYTNLPKGKHKLEVYLANNDHTNAGPEAEVEFTVQ